MKELNPEHIEELRKLISRSPYFRLLNMEILNIKYGRAVVTANVEEKHLTPFGAIHGGAYASMLDSAAYWAVYASLPEDAGWVTLDLNVNFLAPVREGQLLTTGREIKTGKSIALAEATITDGNGKVYAQANSKMLVTGGMQTIGQLLGFSSDKTLPPKYL